MFAVRTIVSPHSEDSLLNILKPGGPKHGVDAELLTQHHPIYVRELTHALTVACKDDGVSEEDFKAHRKFPSGKSLRKRWMEAGPQNDPFRRGAFCFGTTRLSVHMHRLVLY